MVMTEGSHEAEQRRRARRGAIALALVAVAVYIGFIVSVGLRGNG
jgi:hypothetical protein